MSDSMSKPVNTSSYIDVRAVQGGSSINYWTDQIDSDKLDLDNFSVILMHVGVIDVLRAVQKPQNNIQPIHIALRMGSLLESIRKHNSDAYLVVSGIIPVVDRFYWQLGVEGFRRATNTAISRIVAQHEKAIFVKSYDRFFKFSHPVRDYFDHYGLHLSPMGADVMKVWFGQVVSIPAIREALNSNDRARVGKLNPAEITYIPGQVFNSPKSLSELV